MSSIKVSRNTLLIQILSSLKVSTKGVLYCKISLLKVIIIIWLAIMWFKSFDIPLIRLYNTNFTEYSNFLHGSFPGAIFFAYKVFNHSIVKRIILSARHYN